MASNQPDVEQHSLNVPETLEALNTLRALVRSNDVKAIMAQLSADLIDIVPDLNTQAGQEAFEPLCEYIVKQRRDIFKAMTRLGQRT